LGNAEVGFEFIKFTEALRFVHAFLFSFFLKSEAHPVAEIAAKVKRAPLPSRKLKRAQILLIPALKGFEKDVGDPLGCAGGS